MRNNSSIKPLLVEVCSNPTEAGGKILNSWNGTSECQAPIIVGLANTYKYEQHYGPINFCRFDNAVVTPGSDIVRLGNVCYWYKQRHPAFGNTRPLDKDLLGIYDGGALTIRDIPPSQRVRSAFSLLGVHDTIWAHFIVQHLPKLQYLQQALQISPDIVVLANEDLDHQAKWLLNDFLAEMGLSDRLCFVNKEASVHCEELFWVDQPSWLFDESEKMSTLSIVIPTSVVNFLQLRFSRITATCSDVEHNEKIYLRRAGYRSTKNIDEMDHILLSRGFKVVDPGALTLPEKKFIFENARIIVGQLGSAFTNILMCQPGTTVVTLTNGDRLLDHYLPAIAFASGSKLIALPGIDCKPLGPHSDYVIDPGQLITLLNDLQD